VFNRLVKLGLDPQFDGLYYIDVFGHFAFAIVKGDLLDSGFRRCRRWFELYRYPTLPR
jgi:hypothetical protein